MRAFRLPGFQSTDSSRAVLIETATRLRARTLEYQGNRSYYPTKVGTLNTRG